MPAIEIRPISFEQSFQRKRRLIAKAQNRERGNRLCKPNAPDQASVGENRTRHSFHPIQLMFKQSMLELEVS